MVHGAWCMVHGAWCMVHGAWCMVHGAWCSCCLLLQCGFVYCMPLLSLMQNMGCWSYIKPRFDTAIKELLMQVSLSARLL
jgi:hypothetical protein